MVKRIYQEAKEGRTPGKIARRLNADNIPSARGSVWRSNSVRIVLTNPAYYRHTSEAARLNAPASLHRLARVRGEGGWG